MKTLNVSKHENQFVSDVLTMEKASIAAHIAFENKTGSVVVERSIDGINWVVAGLVCGLMNESQHVEFGISGAVTGQKVRLVTSQMCKIEYI